MSTADVASLTTSVSMSAIANAARWGLGFFSAAGALYIISSQTLPYSSDYLSFSVSLSHSSPQPMRFLGTSCNACVNTFDVNSPSFHPSLSTSDFHSSPPFLPFFPSAYVIILITHVCIPPNAPQSGTSCKQYYNNYEGGTDGIRPAVVHEGLCLCAHGVAQHESEWALAYLVNSSSLHLT